MPPDGSITVQDAWVKTALGTNPNHSGTAKPLRPMALKKGNPNSPVSKAAADPKVWTRSVGSALTRQGPYKTGARIDAKTVHGPETVCQGADGHKVSVVKGKDGRVALTRSPPVITEITFAGGGGKGAALPGAVRALSESGVLKTAKELHGASVGSLTAAMLAAGVGPDEFQALSDNTNFKDLVQGKSLLLFQVSGEGFEELVRNTMTTSVGKQIAAYAHDAQAKGQHPDKTTLDALNEMTARFKKGGPTFMDMRVLHGVIPAIKEVVITGTLKAIDEDDGQEPGMPGGKPKPESNLANGPKAKLMVFSADTQPAMHVAQAVHASAALPGIFQPVTLELKGGKKGIFEDGGVMNNVPTGTSLGTDRNLDPVPETGGMSFVFQDDTTSGLVAGKAASNREFIRDKLLGTDMSSAEYNTRRDLADRPEDVVVVPLKFDRKDGTKADFTGTLGGTMKFDMAKDDRIKLQGDAKAATEKHLKLRQAPETRSFASVAQMLACTTRADLVAMAESKFPGAAEELAFRDEVVKQVAALEALAAGGAKPDDKPVQAILKAITAAAAGDQERVGFIGREMNRSDKLDTLLGQAKAHAGKTREPDALNAGVAVAALLAVRKTARHIRTEVLAPKIVVSRSGGASAMLLAQMDVLLQDANSNAEINRALQMGIKYFANSFDPRDFFGDKAFSAALRKQIQPVH